MIRKGLIPVAGLGKRLRPISSVVPKAMLPLVGSDKRVRPIVHYICVEALGAGVAEIALMVTPGHEEIFQRYFSAARDDGDTDIPERIAYIPTEPLGLGYAVAQGEDFVGDEPFMVMLGDHVHVRDPERGTCAGEVVRAFGEWSGAAMIGMRVVGPEALHLVGAARGEPIGENIYRCTHLLEKPDLPTARKTLKTPGLPEDRFLAHCGIYIFTPEIFQCIEQVGSNLQESQELQLTDAESLLLNRHGDDCYLVQVSGRTLDTGTPPGYAAALEAMRNT